MKLLKDYFCIHEFRLLVYKTAKFIKIKVKINLKILNALRITRIFLNCILVKYVVD